VDIVLRYRGRAISSSDVAAIAKLIAEHPKAKRRALSILLCEAWSWRQPNGALCDGVCRGLLLALDRSGHIRLPPPQSRRAPRWRPPRPVEVQPLPREGSLGDLGPIELQQVRRTADEVLVDWLIAEHHYLGFAKPVGEHLKYLVTAGGSPLACFCWTSAPRHLGPRDRYLGWSAEARKANLRYLAYQSRFLILPWVKVRHLASHLLGRMARQLSADWQKHYAHPIYFTETFVDPARYRGTCYRAANWTYLGMTTGRGKDAPTKRPNRPLKQVYGYPLVKEFRQRLQAVG
jgi:hypothetical protein